MIDVAALAFVLAAAPQASQSSPFTLESEPGRTAEQVATTIDHVDLALRVIPDRKALEGVATLSVTVDRPVERLVFELDSVFSIAYIRVGDAGIDPARWANDDGRLTIQLDETLDRGRSIAVRIDYAGQPREAPHAPWEGGVVWGTAPSGEPWIATAVQGEGCDIFWPCIDHPLNEPRRLDFRITVPSDLSAPSNGVLVGTTDHGDGWTTWHWRANQPNTYAVALNIGPYELMQDTYVSRYGNSFPMQYWHLRSDDPEDVAGLFAQFRPMLDFFEANVGPYPFADEKMGVVETPHLGMEHQTINAYGNQYRVDARGYDWLLHHELAHEWFGNQMTNIGADHLWLHEGLGTYMQPLYARWLHGERYMQAELKGQREGLLNRRPMVTGAERREGEVYSSEEGPGNDLYSKGSLVAHSLRMLIGNDAFREVMSRLVYGVADPRPGGFRPISRSTDDLAAIVREVTGRDHDWFFRAYLYNADLPRLVQSREGDSLTLAWDTGDGGVFPMPVEVEIDGRVETVAMTDGTGVIVAPAGAHVLIDPHNKVLRRLDVVDQLVAYRAENPR